MDASHRPLGRPEDLCGVLAEREIDAGEKMISKVVALFEALDDEE
jgi:hypothetical protein